MEFIEQNGCRVALVAPSERVADVQAALDLIANTSYAGGDGVVLRAQSLNEAFFDLRSGLAGEILQKFSTYHMRLAIVGDFEDCQSRALRDFIRECNRGGQIVFMPDQEAALAALCRPALRARGGDGGGGDDRD